MEKRKVIICRGIQGSGKSTWAKKWAQEKNTQRIRFNNDDIRNMMGEYWVPKREGVVSIAKEAILVSALTKGYEVVVDNMNLNPTEDAKIREICNNVAECNGFEVEYEYKDFFIPLEEAIMRDSLRSKPIGAGIIKSTYNRYRSIFNEKQLNRPILVQDAYSSEGVLKPYAVIVDLDGTLALNKANRPYFGESADEGYLLDSPNTPVADVVRRFQAEGLKIIIMTGREGTTRAIETNKEWLEQQGIDYSELIMRAPNDYRPDEVVKLELFNKLVAPKYRVHCVLDDRDKVVKMWRDLGLLCLQVWDGKF